jgi:hypothetical protein
VTWLPSASSIRSDRTVVPIGPNGTGQPWALTLKVAATPKSWFDCMTAGESPSGSSAAMTWLHRAPAWTRQVRAEASVSTSPLSKVIA